ncbi:putative FDF domain-containing protein [Helianthus anomalus]
MKFTEEFDFTAMNEKFNKDEVWGTLRKSKNQTQRKVMMMISKMKITHLPKIDVKLDLQPVYSKGDFFDTLSCNSNDNRNNVRTSFSEHMKLDTEVILML